MSGYHVPVMVAPVLELVLGAPAGAFVDGTLGGGGHTLAIAEALAGKGEDRPLIGIDQDPEALAHAGQRLAAHPFTAVSGNFRELAAIVRAHAPGGKASAILLDIGVSSHQLDEASRGFAIKHPDAPLDMRMNPREGMTALELIASMDADSLGRLLRELEVKDGRRLAVAIKDAELKAELKTTGDLARLVDKATPWSQKKHGVHPATLVFQALRIAVNDELGALDEALATAADVLVPGGRLLVMSYHSLEDRRVKQSFHLGEHGPERPARLPPPSDWRPTWKVLTRGAVTASDDEIANNPRARSARLRAAARVTGTAAHHGGGR